ncbi:retroviral-like aspartic protease family protein [Dyella sp. C11]|uniref:retroviral-like aspartic protease family protein n=1 Tax=Dyella sp. C11 TaxID=2126991 RepID=UPI000D642F4C|nr:retroviral-like aspartic protease family protein [Dyella sp. C11]
MRRALKIVAALSMAMASSSASVALAAEAPKPVSVPLMAWSNGHDTVPVFINGVGPYPFILDTGADGTAVYQWFADQIKLPKVEGADQDLSGQTGSSRVSMYRLDTLALGGVQKRIDQAYALPARKDSGGQAGVVGNDVMDDAVVVFDFPCRKVTIYPKPVDARSLAGPNAHALHTGVDEGSTLLTFPVSLNGVTGTAILDSGSRQTRITQGFARKAGIDPASASFHDDAAIFGTSMNELVPRTGPVGELQFAGMTLKNVTAQVIDLPVLLQDFHGEPAMLVGADVLGRYRLVYDHAARNIWFDTSSCQSQ